MLRNTTKTFKIRPSNSIASTSSRRCLSQSARSRTQAQTSRNRAGLVATAAVAATATWYLTKNQQPIYNDAPQSDSASVEAESHPMSTVVLIDDGPSLNTKIWGSNKCVQTVFRSSYACSSSFISSVEPMSCFPQTKDLRLLKLPLMRNGSKMLLCETLLYMSTMLLA